MDTEVIPALKAAGIGAGEIRLWSAHYTGTAHICGPSTCRELGVSADGTQWTDKAMGRNLDQSLLAAGFFGAVPPANWQETLMNKLPTLQQGAVDKAGQVFFVHRMQALVKVYGEISGMGTVACQMVTGTFDAATKTAVEAIQVSRKLTADGIVGPQTWGVRIAGSAT
jgi:peptidoglycan hydrolase-like protein with peptidoglycan-binding domain